MSVAQIKKLLKNANVAAGNSRFSSEAAELAGQLAGQGGKYVRKRFREYLDTPPNTPKKKVKKNKSYPTLPENNMTKDTNAQNLLVGKTAMKVSGKHGKLAKVRKVKVSKSLREKVKKVLAGQGAVGSSVVTRSGLVGSIISLNNNTINGDDNGGTGLGVACPGQGLPAGSRTLFNQLCTFKVAGDSTIVTRGGMNYFTPGKILDAASVLFNQKTRGDPYTLTGNLTTYFNPADGAPQTTSPGPLVVNVNKSYCTWTMKNVSDRVATVEIWECTPKLKFNAVNPLRDLISFYEQNAVNLGSADRQLQYIGSNTTFSGTGAWNYAVYHAGTIDPIARAQQMGWQWKATKRTMVMNPSETCVHTIKGPSGSLNFKKLSQVDSSGTEIFNYFHTKGWSVGCIVSVRLDQVVSTTDSTLVQRGARLGYAQGVLSNTQMACPIAIEVKEVYNIQVPEIAGFVQNNLAAGTVQQLNLRKAKVAVWEDMLPNQTHNTGDYEVDNEENPLLSSTGNPQIR